MLGAGLIGSATVCAQDAAPSGQAAGNVVTVTGSRIATRGFNQPTPTTTLTSDDIEKSAEPNIFTTIAQLPALQGSTGSSVLTYSTSSGLQGLSAFSLRGLGAFRTLTLLDGQRAVPANVSGATDISQFPQLLVKRVDVVTGGASASYGSDAVGGVVNFITDKKFTGFKANVEGGQTTYHDDRNVTLQAAWGRGFLDDKLHLVVSAERSKEDGVPDQLSGRHDDPSDHRQQPDEGGAVLRPRRDVQGFGQCHGLRQDRQRGRPQCADRAGAERGLWPQPVAV